MKPVLVLACACFLLSGCAYVGTWAKQRYYTFQLRHAPRQRTSKHLLDRQTYFVFGRVEAEGLRESVPVAVLAVSPAPLRGEIVDQSEAVRGGSYYGLNLPSGTFRLIAVADLNGDGRYTETEVVAERPLQLDATVPEKIVAGFDLTTRRIRRTPPPPFQIPVRTRPDPSPSVFYPKGTIRTLEDPIFAPGMSSLGLYQPAAFLEAAPMMFYALEDELGYKVPVIFVHGIDGSAREFADVIAQLDRRRYAPWFFHYPSGGNLQQLGAMFYEIFLSGNTIPRTEQPMVIVAHSMGGLVVREALNRHRGTAREQIVGRLITIASPLAGHPSAARAARAPVVIPSWRDLDPQSRFIQQLHRAPLPAGMSYHLFYTVGTASPPNASKAGDGVVPLSSQLAAAAQQEATEQLGFPCSHTGVLHDPAAIHRIVETIGQTQSIFPPDHLEWCDRGGYALPVPEAEFSVLELYLVRHLGRYMDALVTGKIQPIHPSQVQFIEECRGQRPAETPAAKAWLKLNRLHPRRDPAARRRDRANPRRTAIRGDRT